MQHKFRLVDKVSAKWMDFGSLLDLTQNQLTAWDTQHRGNAALCWKEVMQCWLNGGSEEYPPSWEGLYDLLEDVGCPAVAAELKKAVGKAI